MALSNVWTPAMVDFIRRLRAKGVAASRIANFVNATFHTDFTRNAICGALSRLDIPTPKRSGETDGRKQPRKTRAAQEPRRPRSKAPAPARLPAPRTAAAPVPASPARPAIAIPAALVPEPAPTSTEIAPAVGDEPAAVLPSSPQVGDGCRWIEGSDYVARMKAGEDVYCGRPGHPWCAEHHARCYTKTPGLSPRKWQNRGNLFSQLVKA